MKILPIKDLRNTNEISKTVKEENDPIFITKNGYADMVIMSQDVFDNIAKNKCDSKTITIKKDNIKYKQYNGFGFIKVGCASFDIKVADVNHNVSQIKSIIDEAIKKEVKVLVFPELSLTGYTCSDLFFQRSMLNDVISSLTNLKNYLKDKDILVAVGAPLAYKNKIYNTAIMLNKGHILGVVAKKFLPNYKEFYEARQFSSWDMENDYISLGDDNVLIGNKMIFSCIDYSDLKIGVEICEDMWVSNSPNIDLCLNGATLMLNLSASNEIVGKEEYRKNLIMMTSAKNICGYIYCSSGDSESTTDLVYSGAKYIYENGTLLSSSKLFEDGLVVSEIDIDKLTNERRKTTTFHNCDDNYDVIPFSLDLKEPTLTRHINKNPFVLEDFNKGLERYRLIIEMQARGLKKRMVATNTKKLVVGLSGGLDSTLALLVAYRTFEILHYDFKNLYAITLPCFGTSKRTYNNALSLSDKLGLTFKEINICDTVKSHFKDIEHDENIHNAAYENAQARERTQVLLDYANDINALMVGTGDLSELCLGWTTYNGDHMSSYGVNASIPKTLVKELVKCFAFDHPIVKDVLFDIIDTPISPELLPPVDGVISQKTEDKVGPYELQDFFIYHFLRNNFSVEKIFYLATIAYKNIYTKSDVKKWLHLFIYRFFTNQFKRSVLPDGVKVGSVSISPRGDFRMPSDSSYQSFIKRVDDIVIDE